MQDALWQAERAPYVLPSMDDVRALTGTRGLTAVSSFSGCGGSSLGLRMAGWAVPYAIEFVPAAADSYNANSAFPVDRRDVRDVNPREILDQLDIRPLELDLFEGSPPCASFSSAGQREKGWGEEKKYSDTSQRTDDLFFEWVRLLRGLMPRAFLAENVPGLIAGNAVSEYAHVITGQLSEAGYRVIAKVLNAANYGVPQERTRLIFLGIRKDLGVQPSFPEPYVTEPQTLRAALHRVTDREFVEESSMEGKAVGRTWHLIREAQERGAHPDFGRLPCQRCGAELRAGEHQILKTSGPLVTKALCQDGEKAVIAKDYFMLTVPHLDRPCPTVTATGAQVGAASVTHPTECRKMTPAELRSVCSFPDDFVLTGTREQQCERMGRAVPPLLYRAIGAHLADLLRSAE